MSPSAPLLHCPLNPSLFELIPRFPSGARLWLRKFSLVEKGAVELAPLPSPGFYSRLFVVMKASESWKPVIDLSTLNLHVLQSPFKMETPQSVLLSVRRGDWMVSLDLKDASLQVPVHPDSRKFHRFVALGQVFQFKALCFGLSTAPQVFSRVMAPVSTFLHRSGIRICRYLDDWLLQASSRDLVLQVIHLCRSLGIVINVGKSNLVPSQRIVYWECSWIPLLSGLLPPNQEWRSFSQSQKSSCPLSRSQHHLGRCCWGFSARSSPWFLEVAFV